MTVVLEQVRRWSASGLDAVVVGLDTAGPGWVSCATPWCAAGRPTRGAVSPGMRRAPSTGDWWHGWGGWRPRSASCGPGSSPPQTRSAGCARASPRRRSWPTGAGSRSRRTAPSPPAEPPVAGSAAAVQAEVGDRVEQVLRAAAALDTDLAALLAAMAGAREPVRSTRRRAVAGPPTSAGPAIGVPAPPDGTPADNAGWWSALSPAAQRRVVAEHPEWVGNRDGIPAAVRDEANRALLDGRVGRLDADLRAVQARYDALTAGGPGAVEAVWLAQRNDLLARLDALHRRREVLDAVRTAAAGTDRSVLLLDLDRTHPRAAVAVGDVDTADHVAVLTPGFGTTVRDGLGAEGETAAALRDRSLSALGGAGRGGESVAAVAWLGYDVPAGVVAVSTPDAARSGGADLARFYEGIDASRRADPHLTALGHSYGSLTTGYALQQAHGVDDAVVFGSPGLGTDHVGDLHVPPGHTGVVEAPWDPVADLGWFGDDPNRLDGVTGLSARPATLPDGSATAGSVLHAQYLTPGTTSQFNIAATVAGLPEERILDPGVGVGDVVRGAVGGGGHEDRPCARDHGSDARHPCATAVRPRRRGAPAGSRRGPA